MKFIRILLTSTLIAVGACSSCAPKSLPPVEPPVLVADAGPSVDAAPPPVVIKGANWELTLPNSGWDKASACDPEECQTLMANEELKNVLLVITSTFGGGMDDYALQGVRDAREGGFELLSTKQVALNGHNFVLLNATKGNVKVWAWYTVVKGKGVTVSCGGFETADNAQRDLCTSIVSTLKVN